MADINYWSNLPYTHGLYDSTAGGEFVKYKASPCSVVRSLKTNLEDQNYLQKDIIKRAAEGTICFDIQVQFFNNKKLLTHKNFKGRKYKRWNKSNWIKEGGREWPESVLPFYRVARLEIEKGSTPKDCKDRYINTRVHSTVENLPVGSISRVRTYVEETNRANRMKRSFFKENRVRNFFSQKSFSI